MTSSEEPNETRISISEIASVYRALAEQHAAERQTEDAERAWNRLIQQPLRQRPVWSRARVWVASAAIAAGVAGAVWWSMPDPLTYTVDGRAVASGSVYAGNGPADVRFSDDSHITAAPDSTFQVSVVGERGALTRLASGKLSVEVVEHQRADWRFLAGPYEVQVTGTAFDLSWSPVDSHFQLTMRQGSVAVVGPGLDRRTVRAGESLSLVDDQTAAEHAKTTADEVAASEAAADDDESDVARADRAQEQPTPAGARTGTDGARANDASWPDLVAQGRFGDVVEAAKAAGVDSVLRSSSAEELKALAHSALYSGKSSLALRTWRTVRSRFPASDAGRQAPFFIGRIHQQAGRSSEAMRWLNTYLSESPNGVYASEAAGRRLALVQRVQGSAAAKRAAESYLKRYPSGAYAKTARDMLAAE